MGVIGLGPAMLGRVGGLLVVVILLLSMCLDNVVGRSRGHSRLSLWIDKAQIRELIGTELAKDIPIISDGTVTPFLNYPGLSASMVIPPDVDSVNLTWKAGNENFKYWFENLTSLNTSLLYNPLLSIPTQGWIPHGQTVFQMSIPCTGKEKGVASLLLGLRIYNNRSGLALEGTPISFTLKKECHAFDTSSLCESECENGGTCTEVGECSCMQGFEGKFCRLALCNPICQNNGTCISPEVCACPEGYTGTHCEKATCGRPCENGGRCLPEGYCWCTKGYYGEACEYSHCNNSPCENGGTCIGPVRCQCSSGYSGNQCQHSKMRTDTERPRRSDNRRRSTDKNKRNPTRKKKRRTRKDRKERKAEFEKKLLKTEKRILKIIKRKSKVWSLTREERRVFRKLVRDSQQRTLLMKERNWLSKILTREKDKLTNKERLKLKRYKKLIRMGRRRKPKKKQYV
ncbi:wnt inhibitory factor 1-like isoform X1 [Haliotis rubra]|uniref:wnt inhibitory factor 1-like isoform X1 n=1 Tax=Haliotis rubra TaxID=36100 RepID=UPI001EE5538C|nr:wnt inhibitory factor 1-like isoform X1 [Haliotis rubra]